MTKTLKEQIQKLVKQVIKEQEEELRVWGEQEAIKDLQDWMTIANPHGVTKQEFVKYLNKDLADKYGRDAVMLAFDTIKREKGCLRIKTLKDGREIVVWKKEAC